MKFIISTKIKIKNCGLGEMYWIKKNYGECEMYLINKKMMNVKCI